MLSNDTVFHMDYDDMMEKIRNLMQQKEELQNEIDETALEADAWQQILACSTITELEELRASLPSIATMTVPQHNLLQDYHKISTELQALAFLETTSAYMTEEGNLLLKFVRPSFNTVFSTLLITLSTSDENTYSVCYHNMPKIVPVAKYEKEYLKNVHIAADKTERLKKFITVLSQYTRALYERQEQIVSVEKLENTLNMHVHYNSGCTFLTTLVDVQEVEAQDPTTFELTLDYHPLDILPYKVQAKHLSGKAPSSSLIEIMHDLELDMKTSPFPQVLFSTFVGQQPSQGSTQESSESGSSDDTIVFDQAPF